MYIFLFKIIVDCFQFTGNEISFKYIWLYIVPNNPSHTVGQCGERITTPKFHSLPKQYLKIEVAVTQYRKGTSFTPDLSLDVQPSREVIVFSTGHTQCNVSQLLYCIYSIYVADIYLFIQTLPLHQAQMTYISQEFSTKKVYAEISKCLPNYTHIFVIQVANIYGLIIRTTVLYKCIYNNIMISEIIFQSIFLIQIKTNYIYNMYRKMLLCTRCCMSQQVVKILLIFTWISKLKANVGRKLVSYKGCSKPMLKHWICLCCLCSQ